MAKVQPVSVATDKVGEPLGLPDNYDERERNRSRGVLQSIWQTKEQLGPDDPVDVQIKTTLKELVTYMIFFSVLLVGG